MALGCEPGAHERHTMVDFHDRREDPGIVNFVNSLADDGNRYRVTTRLSGDAGVDPYLPEVASGYLRHGEQPNTVEIVPSTRSKKTTVLHHQDILSIEGSRARKGQREQIYSRPKHLQDGYGRV